MTVNDDAPTRDDELGARLAAMLGDRHPVAAVATVADGDVRVAALGAPLDADYELASLSKGITGLLYADALARGEVTPDTTLGELLPLDHVPAGAATLGALSTHRAGLPRLPAAAHPWRRTFTLMRHGTNPYGESLDELLDQARTVRRGRPRPRYSNLGFELLGHALAAAARTTYADLLASRLSAPLGLEHTYVAAEPHDLRPGALAGRSRRHRPMEPWTGEGLAPAGGIRASILDLARLARALLDGTAPGVAALDPVTGMGPGARIGAAWITLADRGQSVTFHNGRSGGFASWMGLDRDRGAGAAILTATAASVDRHGFRLLAEL